MENRKIYANALLKDGKIMFWWTGDKCDSKYDFYKDFMYAGLNMVDEFKNNDYALDSKQVDDFEKSAEAFYRQYPIHEDSKGARPYET